MPLAKSLIDLLDRRAALATTSMLFLQKAFSCEQGAAGSVTGSEAIQKSEVPISPLFVVVFSLVFDCENSHNIQGWFEAVQGKVASGSKVDHKLTKIIIVFHRPANHVRLFERHKRFADCKHGPFRGV